MPANVNDMRLRNARGGGREGFVACLFNQATVVVSLIIRDLKSRFGINFIGFGWALVTPIAWIGLLVVVFLLLNRFPPIDTDIVSFLATGMVPYVIFRATVTSMNRALATNRHMRFFDNVGYAEIFAAATVIELMVGMLVYVIIAAANYLIVGQLELHDPLMLMTGIALACGLGAGLGRIIALLSRLSDTVGRVAPILLRPMFWISGIFFTANELPEFVLDYFWYNPLLHAIEIVRNGAFLNYESYSGTLWYPAAWVMMLFIAAKVLEARLIASVDVE